MLTDTIKLKDDTVIIGLNPVSTKFILKDNAERFTGYGKGIAFIESGKSVKLAIIMSITGKTKEEASLALTKTEGHMKKAIDLLNKEEK